MNLADVALEALYLLGVLMCCALLSREEGSREGLGSRVLLQCLFDRFGSVFPQCGLMVFPGVVIVSR